MSDYPSLTEMDISGFDEINSYSIQQDKKDRDTLRISYKRAKGSMLPKRKTFHFGRSQKMINDSSAPNGTVINYEISPFLEKVMSELDSIIGTAYDEKDKVKALLKRIKQLERETMYATSEMKAIVKSLK